MIALEAYSTTSRTTLRVEFANEAVAVDYLDVHPYVPGQSFYIVGEVEGEELDPETEPVLFDRMHPTCEHMLSARLCAGPGHYPMDR